MDYLQVLKEYHLSTMQWTAIMFAVFLLGLSKAGIKGIGVVIVIMLAFVFGEKASTGILLPMLIIADIMAVAFYTKYAKWNYVFKLLPWMLVGVLIGVFTGHYVSELLFKRIMATIIFVSLALMYFLEKKKTLNIPNNVAVASSAGLLAGFSTMIGNLAGPISNIYFLAMRLPKNEFIGTAAWTFFIMNLFKLPFHFFVWKTVTPKTLILNSTLIPALFLGFFLGIYIVKLLSNLNYRRFILFATAIGALILLFRN